MVRPLGYTLRSLALNDRGKGQQSMACGRQRTVPSPKPPYRGDCSDLPRLSGRLLTHGQRRLRIAGHVAAFAAVAFLTACANYYARHIYGNEESPGFKVPVDSRFVLTRSLTVPAGSDRIFFQGGRLSRWYEVNLHLPYCVLKLHAKKDVPQIVHPDTFVVQKAFWETVYQLAALQLAQLWPEDGMMDYRVVVLVMELYSERQPDVRRLTCGEWGLPRDIANITVSMIRRLLAEWFTLELALEDVARAK